MYDAVKSADMTISEVWSTEDASKRNVIITTRLIRTFECFMYLHLTQKSFIILNLNRWFKSKIPETDFRY